MKKIAVVLFILFAMPAISFAGWFNDCFRSWGHGHMGYFGGGYMGILLVAIIGIIVYLIIKGGMLKTCGSQEDTSLEILKKRYAKGEITKEEFDKMKANIE
ncbi:MAG: SHOCT domain-containing protein [bacterium]